MALAAALIALAGGCLVQPEAASCEEPSTCERCLERSGCGWCATTASCVRGTSLGPAGDECTPVQWRFTNCQAPPGDPGGCSKNTFCSTCTDDDDCEWCAAEETCVPFGGCGGLAATEGDDCDSYACAVHDTCRPCHGAGCTWCDVDGGQCVDILAGCPYDYTFRSRDACPPPNDCSDRYTCEDCTESDDCVWCWESSQCVAGGAGGASNGDALCQDYDEFAHGDPWECG